eukprot:m.346292 g.346292  ORF g.346292 m.346292 type:complete len:635 (+) comp27906_c0_seq1:920-2824(+)
MSTATRSDPAIASNASRPVAKPRARLMFCRTAAGGWNTRGSRRSRATSRSPTCATLPNSKSKPPERTRLGSRCARCSCTCAYAERPASNATVVLGCHGCVGAIATVRSRSRRHSKHVGRSSNARVNVDAASVESLAASAARAPSSTTWRWLSKFSAVACLVQPRDSSSAPYRVVRRVVGSLVPGVPIAATAVAASTRAQPHTTSRAGGGTYPGSARAAVHRGTAMPREPVRAYAAAWTSMAIWRWCHTAVAATGAANASLHMLAVTKNEKALPQRLRSAASSGRCSRTRWLLPRHVSCSSPRIAFDDVLLPTHEQSVRSMIGSSDAAVGPSAQHSALSQISHHCFVHRHLVFPFFSAFFSFFLAFSSPTDTPSTLLPGVTGCGTSSLSHPVCSCSSPRLATGPENSNCAMARHWSKSDGARVRSGVNGHIHSAAAPENPTSCPPLGHTAVLLSLSVESSTSGTQPEPSKVSDVEASTHHPQPADAERHDTQSVYCAHKPGLLRVEGDAGATTLRHSDTTTTFSVCPHSLPTRCVMLVPTPKRDSQSRYLLDVGRHAYCTVRRVTYSQRSCSRTFVLHVQRVCHHPIAQWRDWTDRDSASYSTVRVYNTGIHRHHGAFFHPRVACRGAGVGRADR